MFVGFELTNDVMVLFLDSDDSVVTVVHGIENDGQSRSSCRLERRDDLFDGGLRLFLERLLEIRRKILWDVHTREVGDIDLTDLETGGDELVSLLCLCRDGIVQPGDAIGGVAGFRGEYIVDVKENLVTSTNLELVEDVLGVVLSKVSG